MSEQAGTTSGVIGDWFVLSTKPIVEPTLREDLSDALTTEQHETLLSCLEANSETLFFQPGGLKIVS